MWYTNSIQITRLHYIITKTNPKTRKRNQRVVKRNSCRITVVLFQHLHRVNVENHEKSIKTANVSDGFINLKTLKIASVTRKVLSQELFRKINILLLASVLILFVL